MRRRYLAVALAVLALTAGCIGAPASTAGSDALAQSASTADVGADSGKTVEVVASGQVQVEPNRAVVRVAVTAADDSVEAVRQGLAENVSQMRASLREAGVDAEQITSSGYDIGRNYRHRDDPSEPKYQGRHMFVVTLNDTGRAGAVVVAAAEGGATQIDGVRFTISTDRRQEVRKRALADALSNARDRAGVIANGTGLALAGVQTARTVEVSADPYRAREFALASANAGGASTDIESGKVTVSTQVQVIYNATSE